MICYKCKEDIKCGCKKTEITGVKAVIEFRCPVCFRKVIIVMNDQQEFGKCSRCERPFRISIDLEIGEKKEEEVMP